MGRMSASALGLRKPILAVMLGGCALLCFARHANAEGPIIVGGSNEPDVVVNDSVLDSLGASGAAPRLHAKRGGVAGPSGGQHLGEFGAIKLHPPRHASTGQASSEHASTGHSVKTAHHRAAPAPADTSPVEEAVAATPAPAPEADPYASLRAAIGQPAPGGTAQAPTTQASAPPAPAPAQPAAPPPTPASPAAAAAPPPPPASAQIAAAETVAPPSPAPAATPVTPASLPAQGGLPAQVNFSPNISDLPGQSAATLDGIVKAMQGDTQLRIQLIAYASGADDQANQARRTSLARAIAVRGYLIDHNISSARIDVRALGNRPVDGGMADRVDIVAMER